MLDFGAVSLGLGAMIFQLMGFLFYGFVIYALYVFIKYIKVRIRRDEEILRKVEQLVNVLEKPSKEISNQDVPMK